MKNPPVFVTVTDQTGRNSSLEISGEKIEIVGVLPHCAKIVPKSPQDALKLKNWLEKWIQDNI